MSEDTKSGYLTKDCVLRPGEDGARGQEVSEKQLGENAFNRLVFNGVISAEPVPELEPAGDESDRVQGRRAKKKSA